MDLLQDNKKKKEKTPAQKIVLTLLIISIMLCVVIGIIMLYLSLNGKNTVPYTVAINGEKVDLSELQMISRNDGQKYVSLKSLSNKLGYDYFNGEFKIAGEDKSKGYIDTKTNIVQFFADSREIYKTIETSKTDYEYYKIDNEVIEFEDNLYIALDDLDVSLNLILTNLEEKNQTSIETPENWIEQRKEAFKGEETTISEEPENMKALAYGYVIINKEDKFGVISLGNGEEIIGNKYTSISFCEYTGNFIVANTDNKFGVITEKGIADIDLQYDEIEIINYNPLLYKVKRIEKYGILNENGTTINDIKYDAIGYPENKAQEINYTLIIPSLNENIPESIVVNSDNQYGLLEIETGKEILNCNLDGIYSATTEDGKIYYMVEKNDKKVFLENYIENLNRVTVTID